MNWARHQRLDPVAICMCVSLLCVCVLFLFLVLFVMFFGFVGSLSTQTSVRPRNDREKNNRRGKRGMTDKENGRMIGGQEMKSKKKKKKKKKQNKNADQKKKSYERTGKRSEARRWWDGRFSYRRWITTGQRRAPGRSALRFCFTTFRFCCSFFYRASVDVSLNLSPSSIKCESCGAGTCCCFFSIRYVWTTECRPQMVIVPRILVSKIHYTGFSKRMNEEGQLLLAPLCWWLFIRTERGLLLFCSVFFFVCHTKRVPFIVSSHRKCRFQRLIVSTANSTSVSSRLFRSFDLRPPPPPNFEERKK